MSFTPQPNLGSGVASQSHLAGPPGPPPGRGAGARNTRVLVGLLVYNGRAFVPRALESLRAMVAASSVQVDVVVFDDASPDPGWSNELRQLCVDLSIGYYCSPRNLGIPRNMNLVLLQAEAEGYDHALLLNSDVIVPANLVDNMVAAYRTASDKRSDGSGPVASVTAWSNNASVFSLPNDDADTHLADQTVVDGLSMHLDETFLDPASAIPVGMGFCLMIATDAIRSVGIMDPVFGRGYCEEVDWCNRASNDGWVHVLARNTFVYHMGSATTRLAGLLEPGHQTVQVNEAIIDERYPDYRVRVGAWEFAGGIRNDVETGISEWLRRAARTRGYVLEATWLPRSHARLPYDPVQIRVTPDGTGPLVEMSADGFRVPLEIGHDGILATVAEVVGVPPKRVRITDHGSVASQLAASAEALGLSVEHVARYPEAVL